MPVLRRTRCQWSENAPAIHLAAPCFAIVGPIPNACIRSQKSELTRYVKASAAKFGRRVA
jgi:hypothetical protein